MILVFKTNVDSISETAVLKPYLDRHPAIHKWNFDLTDCDKVLRIDGKILPHHIIQTLNENGFECSELE